MSPFCIVACFGSRISVHDLANRIGYAVAERAGIRRSSGENRASIRENSPILGGKFVRMHLGQMLV